MDAVNNEIVSSSSRKLKTYETYGSIYYHDDAFGSNATGMNEEQSSSLDKLENRTIFQQLGNNEKRIYSRRPSIPSNYSIINTSTKEVGEEEKIKTYNISLSFENNPLNNPMEAFNSYSNYSGFQLESIYLHEYDKDNNETFLNSSKIVASPITKKEDDDEVSPIMEKEHNEVLPIMEKGDIDGILGIKKLSSSNFPSSLPTIKSSYHPSVSPSLIPSFSLSSIPSLLPTTSNITEEENIIISIPIISQEEDEQLTLLLTTVPSKQNRNDSISNSFEYANNELPSMPQQPEEPPNNKPPTNAIAAGVFCAVFGMCFLCVFIYIIRKTLPERRKKKYAMRVGDRHASDIHFEDEILAVPETDYIGTKTPISQDDNSRDQALNTNSRGSSFGNYNYSMEDDNLIHHDISNYDVSINNASGGSASARKEEKSKELEYDENIIATFGPSMSNEHNNCVISFGSSNEQSAGKNVSSSKSKSVSSCRNSSISKSSKDKDIVIVDDVKKLQDQNTEVQKLQVQIPLPNSDNNDYNEDTPQIGSLSVPKTMPHNNYTSNNSNAVAKANNDTETQLSSAAERSTSVTPELFGRNTTSNTSTSENTSVSSLWNYKMASFISVTENTWDKPISASQTGTYTLSSDSTDEWIYDKAAEVIVDDPQQQLHQQEQKQKQQSPMDNKIRNKHYQEEKLPEVTTKMAPIAPPTYTNIAKITSYDAFDKTSDVENGSHYSAIEMEMKPERIAELEKKVAEKMKLGASAAVLSKSSDLIKRSCIAPPGKLGVFIDTSKSGPVIHNVKETSPMYDALFTGDQIIAIDDVDVRSMTAAAVTKIMTKRAKYNRKITVLSANHCV